MAEEAAELDAEVAGQKFKYTGPLNTLASVIAAGAAIFACYIGVTHSTTTREDQQALVNALKEQTQALRENTCAATYQGPVEQKSAFCKQVTR